MCVCMVVLPTQRLLMCVCVYGGVADTETVDVYGDVADTETVDVCVWCCCGHLTQVMCIIVDSDVAEG